MKTQPPARAALIGLVALADVAAAQKPPAVRPLGPIERVSAESLASVAAAVPMPGGRVLVNDITGRRVLLFDSTLAHPVVVADTTSATANAYGRSAGTLIPYRGDSALFIDPSSLSMLVIGPAGQIARVLAIPRPGEAQFLIGDIFGTPGFDARGRLVYYEGPPEGSTFVLAAGNRRLPIDPATGKPRQIIRPPEPDSATVVRVNLESRALDTAAFVKIPHTRYSINTAPDGLILSTQTAHDPLPVIDDWTVLPDGTIAVVRGRDYHVDWLDASGRWTSSPKMPFDWQRLDDERKRAVIDSAANAEQAQIDEGERRSAAMSSAASSGASGGGGRAGGGGRGGGAPGAGPRTLPMVAGRMDASEISDYMPAFARGAVQADADGNVWIRTTTKVNGQPVYDIVNRRGELSDRVQLPPFRRIAGFAPGRVFMAVKDSAGVVHLERARVR